MKKFVSLLMIATLLAAMLTVCAYAPDHVEPELSITLCDSQPESSLIGQAEQQFGKYLEEASNGRIVLKYYPDAALGDNVSCMQQVQLGALDMCRCDTAVLKLFDLPSPSTSQHVTSEWLQAISAQDNGMTAIGCLADSSSGSEGEAGICPVVFSDLTWNKLSAGDQEIIVDCWDQAFQWYVSQSRTLPAGRAI